MLATDGQLHLSEGTTQAFSLILVARNERSEFICQGQSVRNERHVSVSGQLAHGIMSKPTLEFFLYCFLID